MIRWTKDLVNFLMISLTWLWWKFSATPNFNPLEPWFWENINKTRTNPNFKIPTHSFVHNYMIYDLKLVWLPKKLIYGNWSSAKIRRLIIHEVSLPSSNLSKSTYLATKPTLDDKSCNYLQKCVWEFQNLNLFSFYRHFLKIMVLKVQCYLKNFDLVF